MLSDIFNAVAPAIPHFVAALTAVGGIHLTFKGNQKNKIREDAVKNLGEADRKVMLACDRFEKERALIAQYFFPLDRKDSDYINDVRDRFLSERRGMPSLNQNLKDAKSIMASHSEKFAQWRLETDMPESKALVALSKGFARKIEESAERPSEEDMKAFFKEWDKEYPAFRKKRDALSCEIQVEIARLNGFELSHSEPGVRLENNALS